MKLFGLFRKKKPPSEAQKTVKLEESEILTYINVLKDTSIATGGPSLSPREEAAVKLGEAQDRRAIQPLLDILTSETESERLRMIALEALGKIGGEEVKEGIINAFKSGSEGLRKIIVYYLDPEKGFVYPEKGLLSKTGLTKTDLYGETAEEMPSQDKALIDKAERCYKEGEIYWSKRNWKKALAKFKETASLNPNHSAVHEWLARIYIHQLEDIQEAEKELRKQIEVNYDNFYAHAILSIIYKARGMMLESREEEIRAMQTTAYRQYYTRISQDEADKVSNLIRKQKK